MAGDDGQTGEEMNNKFDDHKDFFERTGGYYVNAVYYECEQNFTVEEMYQHFKARFLEEYMPPGVVRVDPD